MANEWRHCVSISESPEIRHPHFQRFRPNRQIQPVSPPRGRRAKGCCKAAAQPVSLVSQSEMNRRVIADITQSHLAIISRQVI
ncbi:hypothetical protein DF032_26305 [Burkholderia seminalis]|nr:hypothetical protein DF032_26305 [Burkholderia seminalis]